MIRYRLKCAKDHEFESWFSSSAGFDRLAKRSQIECPECGSKKVSKALMAPGVATRSDRTAERALVTAAPEAPPVSPEVTERAELQRKFVEVMRQIRKEVESKAEYVGARFAEEARRMHHEEAEARGIWGEATIEEAKELHEEGIDCLPLPALPEEKN